MSTVFLNGWKLIISAFFISADTEARLYNLITADAYTRKEHPQTFENVALGCTYFKFLCLKSSKDLKKEHQITSMHLTSE